MQRSPTASIEYSAYNIRIKINQDGQINTFIYLAFRLDGFISNVRGITRICTANDEIHNSILSFCKIVRAIIHIKILSKRILACRLATFAFKSYEGISNKTA